MNSLSTEQKHWILSAVLQLQWLPSIVLNGLCSSNILSQGDLTFQKLNYHQLGRKNVYDSSQERLATFLDTAAKTLEQFHKKLVVLQVDERLSLAIYIPQKIVKSQDYLVHDTVRVFAFPHVKDSPASGGQRPTKKNYRLYCDDNLFQLFENQRSNTWIFIRRGASDDAAYRNTTNQGDRRRQRQSTIESGKNFDDRVSVALNKCSQELQRYIGRVNSNGLLAAEIFVISNRDVESLRCLDLWLNYIETEQVLPLFDEEPRIYSVDNVAGANYEGVSEQTRR
ncbi:uncharacterized protein B0I36DRAFT_368668 [Microdochium trichocladiopsis]|uniref:Uncharacterized protein n=1 Tax=Microdochium trichocladiopsis TaxID=1682393 RepID=A0A9P8XUB1_9PEZI|nr:uncharacterized protein B0I36DRAFT_368668 [Microdochium trichocladiopsis]KAH7016049.1 hypothetical protein B0I36DRAFT_368668 [Microdochium trichocladiopsis]